MKWRRAKKMLYNIYMIVLAVENLTLGYGAEPVVEGLSFEVLAGDFVCIVGENGSGKSTLAKGILGLLKPQKGEIIYGGGMNQRKVGYMPQESKFDAKFPATVEEIVRSGALGRMGMRPFYGDVEKQKTEQCLKDLKILKLRKKSFADLSGGQKQKVLLARALMASEGLLILDEPSNNLDYASRKELRKVLCGLNKRRGLTIMMITHDLDHDNLLGNKILSLNDGEYFFGTTAEFVRKVHHE